MLFSSLLSLAFFREIKKLYEVKKTAQQTPGLFPEIQQLLTFYHICSLFLCLCVCVHM